MKNAARFVAPLTAVAILSGCAGGSGVRFSDLFDESAAAEGTGVQGSSLVRAVVILATHKATPQQIAVAQEHGRRAVAKLKARIAAAEPRRNMSSGEKKPAKQAASAPKPRKKMPRVIAIATEKNSQTDGRAAKAVMLFDTDAQQIIGNKVYDIEKEPSPGEDVRFETQSANYLGASL
jgi:hypothetical protein